MQKLDERFAIRILTFNGNPHLSAKTSCSQRCFLGPAKTYILRGTPRTYVIKTRAVTDNKTIKKGLRKGNRGPVTGTDGPFNGNRGPCNRNRWPRKDCTKTLLIAPVPVTVLIVSLRADLQERPILYVLAGPKLFPRKFQQFNGNPKLAFLILVLKPTCQISVP